MLYVRKSPFGIYVADVTPVTCVYGLHLCLGLISDYVFKIHLPVFTCVSYQGISV